MREIVSDYYSTLLANFVQIITTPSWLLYSATLYVFFVVLATSTKAYKRLALILCLWLVIAIAPIGHWLLKPLENRFTNPVSLKDVKGIIVLGGGQRLGPIQKQPYSGYGQHSARMIAGLSIAKQHELPLYFVGGQRNIDGVTYHESTAIAQLHQQWGLDSPLIIDNTSRNTFDNAIIAKRLLIEQPSEQFILITSAAHMPRAMGVFQRIGLNPIPYSVNYHVVGKPQWFNSSTLVSRLYLIDYAAHEWLGMIQYYTLGRSTQLFPKNS